MTEQVDALVTDRYLESLLLAAERRAHDAPVDASLPPELRATARRLAATARRVAPSVRFEERLAATLAAQAQAQAQADARTGDPAGAPVLTLVPARASAPSAPSSLTPALTSALTPMHDASNLIADGTPTPQGRGRTNRLVIGGAITSVAISIAGGVFLARRRRTPAEPV